MDTSKAAAALGRRGGKAGTGANKRRESAHYRAMAERSHVARSLVYSYGAHTSTQDGTTLEHVGTLKGAIAKARAYARRAFPAWEYAGHGPTVVVRDAAGVEVHRETL
jgi:hypothetical protein